MSLSFSLVLDLALNLIVFLMGSRALSFESGVSTEWIYLPIKRNVVCADCAAVTAPSVRSIVRWSSHWNWTWISLALKLLLLFQWEFKWRLLLDFSRDPTAFKSKFSAFNCARFEVQRKKYTMTKQQSDYKMM